MTDAELQASWPNLGMLVTELRRLDRSELANRLIDSMQSGSTSGEVYSGVGHALTQNRTLRRSLSAAGRAAWERVLEDIDRAYGMPGVMRWLMRMWRRL